MNLARALLIAATRNFRDEELLFTEEELKRAGIATTIASEKPGKITGMFGATATAEIALADVKVGDYDAVVFIGGSGASAYFNNKRALSIASEASKKGKKVCAICIAPVILANAGVLKGKRATVWNGDFIRRLEAMGATYTGKSVEVDGDIITGNGPEAAREFGRTIAKVLR
jgi:protease I